MSYTLAMRTLSSSTLFVMVVTAALSAVAETETPTAPQPPNILLLIADDLGWSDVSSGRGNHGHGSRYHQTPNIDRIANEGTSFTAAYAYHNGPPTRATLHSGQNPVRHWVYSAVGFEAAPQEALRAARIAAPPGHRMDLPPSKTSIAETLRTAGYRTGVIGEVHGFGPVRNLDAAHGFDINLALSDRQSGSGGGKQEQSFATRGKDQRWHFARAKFDRFAAPYTAEYVARNLAPIANGNDPSPLVGTPKHLTDAVADAALYVIAEEARRRTPFYLEVAFRAVRKPARPRPDLRTKYAARKSGDLRHSAPGYAALVEGIDQSVGRIVAALDDPNRDGDTSDSIRDETLVVFLSDNGGSRRATSNAPLRGGEGTFFEGGLRVPWIMRMPGTLPAKRSIDEPVQVADLFPTFAELAGAPLPPKRKQPLDGESLLPLLRGDVKELAREAIFWHFPGYRDKTLTPLSIINRRHAGRRFKLTWSYESLRYSLFDVTRDRGEHKDLLLGTPKPENAQAAARLSRDLRNWVIALKAPRGWVRALNVHVKAPPVYDAGS